jgi:hypothetical protein
MRLEVGDCGDGREALKLRVVMVGANVRELGGRLRLGSTVNVIGALRAVPVGSGVTARGVEVVASEIREVSAGSGR